MVNNLQREEKEKVMPYGKGTYGKQVGRPKKSTKKASFKNCASCKSKAACKKMGRCMKKAKK